MSKAEAPLRVAIFGESYLPYLSGVTVATEALARGLRAAGHEVLLVVPRPAGTDAMSSAGTGGPQPDIAWLPSYQGPPPAPPAYRMPWPMPSRALARATSFRPDVVHAQSPFVSGLMARRLARRQQVPFVFTHHTRFGDYAHYLGPLAGPVAAGVSAYLRAWWRGCAAVVAPSSDLAAEIERAVGGRPRPVVATVPTGLDLAALGAVVPVDPRAAAGWDPDTVVVTSVGRLAREKSVDLVLDAFARAAASDPRLRLLLVGDGPLRGALKARASEPDVAGRVAFTGRLPRLEALAHAAGSDLFAFASRTETQGLVLAEALAMGLPVVALDGPGVRDTVRDGVDGAIVGRDGVDPASALAGAIAAVARNPARRGALSQAAREGAGRFGLEARIGQMVELYRRLIGPPPA